jgi:hypothetical protein
MQFDLRIESAKDYNELRERLAERGYKDIPSGASPLLNMKAYSNAPVVATSCYPIQKTMIQKQK